MWLANTLPRYKRFNRLRHLICPKCGGGHPCCCAETSSSQSSFSSTSSLSFNPELETSRDYSFIGSASGINCSGCPAGFPIPKSVTVFLTGFNGNCGFADAVINLDGFGGALNPCLYTTSINLPTSNCTCVPIFPPIPVNCGNISGISCTISGSYPTDTVITVVINNSCGSVQFQRTYTPGRLCCNIFNSPLTDIVINYGTCNSFNPPPPIEPGQCNVTINC